MTIFLGVLELIKRGRISAVQEDQNAPLRIIPIPGTEPVTGSEEENGQAGPEEIIDD